MGGKGSAGELVGVGGSVNCRLFPLFCRDRRRGVYQFSLARIPETREENIYLQALSALGIRSRGVQRTALRPGPPAARIPDGCPRRASGPPHAGSQLSAHVSPALSRRDHGGVGLPRAHSEVAD